MLSNRCPVTHWKEMRARDPARFSSKREIERIAADVCGARRDSRDSFSRRSENAGVLTILVGYDVRIDVIDRLLGLRVHRGGCTCIRRLAHDGSVLWTPGSAGEVLPAERHYDYSYGQDQKGRRGCQAQQQRIQHRCVGVACRDSRCKMLDQLELLSIIPCIPTPRQRHDPSLSPDPAFCPTRGTSSRKS